MLAPQAFDEGVETVPCTPALTELDALDSVSRAERLLVDSIGATTRSERRQQARLAGVVQDAALRELTFALTDEVLRFESPRRAAARFHSIVADIGVPPSLGPLDRLMLRVGAALAPALPWAVMPLVRSRIVREPSGFWAISR